MLVATGAASPRLLPLVGLCVAVAIAIQRCAVFSSELAVTAESAVLFAALVVFRRDAPYLGPLLVAVSTGPLDVVHWRQRSFDRMAFNAGSQTLAMLAGATTFDVAIGAWGSSTVAVLGAALVASVPFVIVDSALGIALMVVRRDGPVRAASVHVARLNLVVVGLAIAGACAGVAAPLGWWVTALALAATVFVPEWLLTPPRRTLRRVLADVGWSAPSLAVLVSVAIAARDAAISVPLALVAGALIVDAFVSWWGRAPWGSTVLSRAFAAHARPRAALIAVSTTAATLALVATGEHDRGVVAFSAAGAAELGLAMVTIGVRQWRFEGRWRARLAITLVATTALVACGAQLGASGAAGPIATIAAAVVVALVIGTPIARRVAFATKRAALPRSVRFH